MHHELPARLDLDWYRKQAKQLVRDHASGEADAVERVEEVLGERARTRFRLSDAQWVIAQEHGFRSWAEFRRFVDTMEPKRPVGRIGRRPVSAYAEEARELLARVAAGDEEAERRVQAQAPYADVAGEGLRLRDAKVVVAREYGFPTWRQLAAMVERAFREHEDRPAGALGRAYGLMGGGDLEGLRRLLDEQPGLVRERYQGAAGTLLEALAQPENHDVDLAVARLLVKRGSELNGPLNLAACFNHAGLVRLLLEAGADPAPSEIWGITPLQTAVYHGAREAADLLARGELVPDAFYLAAGAGRLDLLERWFDGGRLRPEALERRPDLSDVGWPPGAPPRRTAAAAVDEAFALAAFSGRLEAAAFLLDRGASPDGRVDGLPALQLAIIAGRLETVRWLLERGADPWATDAVHGRTAVGWAAGEAARGDDERAAIRELLLASGPPPNLAAAFEAAWATFGARAEAVLTSERTYDGRRPVRVRVSKRDGRYLFSDDGAAVAAAGRPPGWLEAARAVAEARGLNLGRNGAVSVPATSERGLSWLAALPERVAECSAAVYSALLELD